MHARIAPGQTVAHQPVGGHCDLGPRGLAECVGAEVREDRAGRKVGGCVRQVLFDPRQRLINGKPARGENHLGHAFLESLDDLGNRGIPRNGVVDRMGLTSIDGERIAVDRYRQFAKVSAVVTGLHDRRTPIGHDRAGQHRMTVSADDNVYPGHFGGKLDIRSVSKGAVRVRCAPRHG